MLIICDFDGTVTARDTNSELARRFAPDARAQVAGKLASRELTLRQVMDTEFESMTASIEEVVEAAKTVPFRAGFERFLDAAERAGVSVVLLSSGFREIIEPMLEHGGVAGRVPLVANGVELRGEAGGRITWRDLPECDRCGEPCKRDDIERLRRELAGDGEPVVFVGDGFSDRCGAEAADRIFARDNLATWLDEHGVAYEAWEDFDELTDELGLERAPGEPS